MELCPLTQPSPHWGEGFCFTPFGLLMLTVTNLHATVADKSILIGDAA